MIDIDIDILSDGRCLVPRGSASKNQIIQAIISVLTDEDISGFFEMTDDSDLIVGEQGYCG